MSRESGWYTARSSGNTGPIAVTRGWYRARTASAIIQTDKYRAVFSLRYRMYSVYLLSTVRTIRTGSAAAISCTLTAATFIVAVVIVVVAVVRTGHNVYVITVLHGSAPVMPLH